VLLSGFYVVPLHHQPDQWVAHWANVRQPDYTPVYGVQFPTWWDDGSRTPQN
jgi:peptide/nickel transport system substrate-binding protein